MKKYYLVCLIASILLGNFAFTQDTLRTAKSFNLPSEHYGISFGNSYDFNGIRLNFADENLEEINGVNVTLWFKFAQNMESVVNGINIGIIPTGGTTRGINIGLFGVGGHHDVIGFNIAGVAVGCSGEMNGL